MAVAPVVEIVRVSIKNAESRKAAEQVWERMCKFLTEGHERRIVVTYGASLNLEECIIVGILGWPSSEVSIWNPFQPVEFGMRTNTKKEQSTVSKEAAFTEGLDSLRSLGEVSQIIVDVSPLALPALQGASET